MISISLRKRLKPKSNFTLKLVNYKRIDQEYKNLTSIQKAEIYYVSESIKNPAFKEYIFEECFYCVYYGHLSFNEAYNLPIKWRKWWLRKISEINEQENQKNQQSAVQPVSQRSSVVRARDVGR